MRHELMLAALGAALTSAPLVGATVTVTGSAGSAGTVSVNGGTAAATATAAVEEGASVTFAAMPDDGFAFSHWTCDADDLADVDAYSSSVTVTARDGLSLTAVFGLRNKSDDTDTRPHGYLNRFTTSASGTWTDGVWTDEKNAAWWLDGYVPSNRTDVMHFTNWEKPDVLFNASIGWPSGSREFGTIADSSWKSTFLGQAGWGNYYTFLDQSGSWARWQTSRHIIGGFGTTDANTPHRINRVWVPTALGVNAEKEGHDLTIHELSGAGFVRKVGSGRLTLEQPSGGGLRLEEGTVTLGIADVEDGFVPGAAARFDASATDTMTWAEAPDGKTRLTKWTDADGHVDNGKNLVHLKAPYSYTSQNWTCYGPTAGAKTVRGVSLLDFGAYTKQNEEVYSGEVEALGAGAGMNLGSGYYNNVRAAFMAFEFSSQGGANSPVSYWGEASGSPKHLHVRGDGFGLMSTRAEAVQCSGAFYENGAPFKSLGSDGNGPYRDAHSFAVIGASVTNDTGSVTNTVSFWHMGLLAGECVAGGIRVAEALVYTNALTDAEIARNNRWMQLKWHDRAVNDVYPWTLDYLVLCNATGDAAVDVPAGRTAAVRTVHRPTWSKMAGRPLVKTGAGTLELDRCSTNLDVQVKAGRVRFVRETAKIADEPEPAPYPAVWLDATQTDRFVFEEGSTSNVVAWLDRRPGSDASFTNSYSGVRLPTLNANGLHGKPCVDFGTSWDQTGPRLQHCEGTNLVKSGYSAKIADGFVVWRNIAPTTAKPFFFQSTGVYGAFQRGTNNSLHEGYDSNRTANFRVENWTAMWRVDGRFMLPDKEFNDAGRDEYVVVRHRAHGSRYITSLGGAAPGDSRFNYGGGCQIAEFIGYDYMLSDFAARQTEAYLMKKWQGAAHPDARPELDRIDSLTFADGVEPVLETASDRGFGRIAGSGTLVKKGAGRATVGTLSGFSGVSVQGGALAVSGADAALPAALTFTVPKEGTTAPLLTVPGTVDLSAVTSVRVDVEGGAKPVPGDYPLVTAGSFTGSLGSGVTVESNASRRAVVSLVVVDGTLRVRFQKRGWLFLLR